VWNIQIIFAIDRNEYFVAGFGLVVADKANVAITVFACIRERSRKRHQAGDVRRPESPISQLQLPWDSIADTDAIIRAIAHGRTPSENWSDGVLEYWIGDSLSNPLLHHSTTPLLHFS
jgi:hypothetical protein